MTIETVTGSTGNAIQDGAARGIIAGALTAVMVVIADRTAILTTEDVASLAPLVIALSYLFFGLYDRYVRPSA